jgi:hypothetical protein
MILSTSRSPHLRSSRRPMGTSTSVTSQSCLFLLSDVQSQTRNLASRSPKSASRDKNCMCKCVCPYTQKIYFLFLHSPADTIAIVTAYISAIFFCLPCASLLCFSETGYVPGHARRKCRKPGPRGDSLVQYRASEEGSLEIISYHGRLQIAKFLVECCADVDIQNRNKQRRHYASHLATGNSTSCSTLPH